MTRRSSALAAALALCLVPHLALASPGEDGEEREKTRLIFEMKGYALSLWTVLDEQVTGESYTLGTNRFRFDTDARYGERLNLKAQIDLELYAGSLIRSPLWDGAGEPQDTSYWDFDGGRRRGSSLFQRQSIHRLYVTYETDALRTDVGKQRVAWGVMRYWRPTDVFNPESPLQIEAG